MPPAQAAPEWSWQADLAAGAERRIQVQQTFWCLFYSTGIIATLVVYGLLQENIMTHGYGPDGALFSFSLFLVFWNRVAAALYAVAMAVWYRESLRNNAPLWRYLIVSLANVYASACQYEALKYVSFAVQQLGKSFKMMPVMMWGIIISRKTYSVLDWLIAALVTVGVTEFLLTGPISSNEGASNSWKGLALLVVFLALDGLTSTMQEKLFKENKTTKYNQMMYVNILSSIVSMITLVSTGTLVPSFQFFATYPEIITDTAVLSASAVAGQSFIYSEVKEFGALVLAATMNVRQVVSIVFSYMIHGHSITGLQVLGLVVTFCALFYKSYVGLAAEPTKEEQSSLLPRASESTEDPASRDPEKIA
jgi:adenosine 3'-phospho 5'-phosphosulfate transporter B2